MKPLKLTMSAFGSYADVQNIDFTELGDVGLYLITGETGSGKTTIFDAISFALYGKASGDARKDFSSLRSDFAADKAKTFVELDFASGDNRYNIKRTINKSGQNASLILPDGSAMSGDRNINQKIVEITGLDREQFTQIVMIAQNDFLKFINSNTDERLKILRRIFGTERLRQFQEQLKSRVKRESDSRALLLHDFARYEVDVYKRDEQFAEWKTQIESDRATLTDIDKRLFDYDKRKQALAAALAVAEELCKKFNDLSKCRQSLNEYMAKAHEIEKMKIRADRGEVSLYKVKPLDDNLQTGIKNHTVAHTDLMNAQKQKFTADAELAEAAKHIETLPPLAEAQANYAALLKEWEIASQDLKQLLVLKENSREIANKRMILTKKEEELTAIQKVLSSLPPISDYQAELDKTSEELKNSENRFATLSALQKDYVIITQRQKDLAKKQTEFERLNANFVNADKNHRVLEEAFLRSQAGVIARVLIDGNPCPVCGSTEHPVPAKLSNDDIDESKLKKAKEQKDKAQSERELIASVCGALQTETATLSKRFIFDFAATNPHVSVVDPDISATNPHVSAVIPDISATIPNIKNDLDCLGAGALLPEFIRKTQTSIQEISKKKAAMEKMLADLKDRFEKSSKKRDELSPIITSLQSETDTLTKRFLVDFSAYIPNATQGYAAQERATWESSCAELDRLLFQTQQTTKKLNEKRDAEKKSLDLLATNWDAAIKRKGVAETNAQSAATRVSERAANEQKLMNLRDGARINFEAALRNNKFANEADYRSALISENNLNDLRKQILIYEKNYEQLKHDISRLEKETAEKEQPDVSSLRTESEGVNRESKILSEKRDEINGRLSKIESALKYLRRVASDFEKSEKVYAAVKQLADAANGKLDFETYAQMAYFERVLRAANLRLKVMSQNRYALLRKIGGGDGRKRSGLDMEALDSYTGKARSANSLSGGESFMASLSLALGLSDVVQQSVGGVRLDAMFIDEGFGTLDADVLELAVRTLSETAGMNRIIGIISHVAELRERIDKQVQVEKTSAGSKIHLSV